METASIPGPVKVVFFDVRDTLGEVDRPGHLVPYRPSTEKLLAGAKAIGLRIGAITNLPKELSDAEGREMVVNAVLSENAETKKPRTIGDFISRGDVVTNHEARYDKPDPRIFLFAAKKLGCEPSECLFCGENYLEVLGAEVAGFRTALKPCPPGREFLPALATKLGESPRDSGRQFEAMLEHEHLLGERIFACGARIAEELARVTRGKVPERRDGRWKSPPPVDLPEAVHRAMGYYQHLIDHFADPVHFRAEEAMLDVAVARGLRSAEVQWVRNQHEQARAYWGALDVAWRRIESGDADDRFFALEDYRRLLSAFVDLFEAHAARENDEVFPKAGASFDDADDALVLNIVQHSGYADITPYVGMVERMERLLGVAP